jgi:3-mercaptopyruvate sulfurtransferase SseA
MTQDEWYAKAKVIIKAELAKKDISYEQLSEMLKEIGVDENKMNIANKLNRGKFSFSFALQIFKALGLKKLNLEDL